MKTRDKQRRNQEAARKLKAKIALQLKRGARKGVEAAIRFLAARLRETLSVPAPKQALRGSPLPGKRLGPILGYRATSAAIPGAPPRVLSGRLRQSVTHKMLSPTAGLVGSNARAAASRKYPEGFNYPRYHELGRTDQWAGGKHQFIRPTVDAWRQELVMLVGAQVRTELRVS